MSQSKKVQQFYDELEVIQKKHTTWFEGKMSLFEKSVPDRLNLHISSTILPNGIGEIRKREGSKLPDYIFNECEEMWVRVFEARRAF